MSLTGILTGLKGAMGLYSGIKGMFDSAKNARRQKRLLEDAKAAESGWYRRNYYGNFLNNSASRAAIKRVEDTMRRNQQQNRATSRISGATPELTLAHNAQAVNAYDNMLGALAAQEDERRARVDAQHINNQNALRQQELSNLRFDEESAASSAASGLNLLQDALMAIDWGKED